ncbi:unnamed protein product [Anisakis simplex]|uniref:Fringe-like glycosyltransferase domain-containing protein n=1 Tax=Anisakis simplex TaxID=6269 RepID=A0A3P6QHI1_ANISI|nr:unnamed protein product [Anisakis simplex]
MADLNEIIIAVRTTRRYHENRAKDITETWFQLAPHNIYFVTDSEDETFNKSTRNHVIVANECDQQHTRNYLRSTVHLHTIFRWSCHFDDDNYVNLMELSHLLKQLNPSKDWYLGKPSTTGPISVDSKHDKVKFWFATGGAGFCLSRSLITKMGPYIKNGGFERLAEHLKLPDDVTLGYLIEHLLNVKLTVVNGFHSHLEELETIEREDLFKQISFSAGDRMNSRFAKNLVDVPQEYAFGDDPQRFRSLHCFLFRLNCRR